MGNYKKRELRMLKCMNSQPETSKWGDWAPENGCNNSVEVGDNVAKVLCSECTQRTVNEFGEIRNFKK